MALQTMIDNLNAARTKYEAELKAIGETAQAEVGKFLGPLIPKGWAVQWTQYTPHFNDGEACNFSVHEPYLIKVGKRDVSEDDEDDGKDFPRHAESAGGMGFGTAIARYGRGDETKTYETHDWTQRVPYGQKQPTVTKSYVEPGFPAIDGYSVEDLERLSAAWGALPEDLLEKAFGDHVRCRVLSDSTAQVVEHDHD